MADPQGAPQAGTCVYCHRPVTRADDEALWKTESGAWQCTLHPRGPDSSVRPHKVG
jgi:hypothetical protein